MTISKSTIDTAKLIAVALDIFKGRSSQPRVSPRQLAIECFRDATAFNEVAEEVQTGGIGTVAEDTNPLDMAFAPNLKRTHPINLMSRAWGDLNKVQAVMAELDANPAAEFYEPFGWGKPEVNQARALFPAVVSRAKHSTTAK
jgi:hypothetical protein